MINDKLTKIVLSDRVVKSMQNAMSLKIRNIELMDVERLSTMLKYINRALMVSIGGDIYQFDLNIVTKKFIANGSSYDFSDYLSTIEMEEVYGLIISELVDNGKMRKFNYPFIAPNIHFIEETNQKIYEQSGRDEFLPADVQEMFLF